MKRWSAAILTALLHNKERKSLEYDNSNCKFPANKHKLTFLQATYNGVDIALLNIKDMLWKIENSNNHNDDTKENFPQHIPVILSTDSSTVLS